MKRILLAISLVFAILMTGCSGNEYLTHTPTNQEKQQIHWQKYNPALLSPAKRLKRPVLLYFSSDYCDHCKDLESTTFNDGVVIQLINNLFVPFKIKDDDSYFYELSNNNGVEIVPTIVVLAYPEYNMKLAHHVGFVGPEILIPVLRLSLNLNDALDISNAGDSIIDTIMGGSRDAGDKQ